MAQGVPVLTDAELLYRACAAWPEAKFAGITGTNGKSTTTALLAHICAVAGVPHAAGANLGPAALSLQLLPDTGVYVLEMSSYMLERIVTLRFDAAAMLDLSPDHLDRHGDMAGYDAAKREIFARQTEDDVAVIGIDDEPSRQMAAWLRGRKARVVEISGKNFAVQGAQALPGAHNAQNAAAAAALAQPLAFRTRRSRKGSKPIRACRTGSSKWRRLHGVRFINDSKATNADAASRAMGCYDRFIWIAGGVGKAGGIEDLAALFPRVAKAFLIGRDAEILPRPSRAMAWHTKSSGLWTPPSRPLSPWPAPMAFRTSCSRRRRPVSTSSRISSSAASVSPNSRGSSRDARSVARRHLDPRPLVVERRPRHAAGARGVDRHRLRAGAGCHAGHDHALRVADTQVMIRQILFLALGGG